MSKNVIVVPKQTPTVLMVPRKAVKQDLMTETNTIVYMPLATKNNYGVVKIGGGLVFDDSGSLILDRNEVPILKISKNGVEISPDENKLVNIVLTKVDVGLSEVDNTSDENKPLSKASRDALSGKVDIFQGVDNVDKVLTVNAAGEVVPKKFAVTVDKNVMSDVTVRIDGDNFNLIKHYVNLKSLNELEKALHLTLANDNQSGLMSIADYKSIRDLQARVGHLEQKTTRLLYDINYNPSADEINNFVMELGYTEPFEGIAVLIEGTHHIWHFYEGGVGWKDDGLDVVSNFTNEIAGIIKGSAENGKVYAETDGTGSVYGWDVLTNSIATLSEEVVRKTDFATYNKAGVVISTSALGTQVSNAGYLQIVAANEDELKAKTSLFKPIVPSTLDKAIKIGLTTNSETWSDTDKAAARNLISAVGTTDYATDEIGGVLRGVAYFGFKVDAYGRGTVVKAEPSEIDAKTSEHKPIVPSTLDYAVKKALSDNKLEGTKNAWTDDDKTAVKNLLGVVSQVEYSTGQTFADGSDAGVIGRLYMRFRDNTENSIVAHCHAMKYTVPVRDAAANFYVGDPTQPYHCANVKSVTALTGTGAPTENTKALYVGQLYQNTTDDTMYQCSFIDTTNKIYTWKRLIRETDYPVLAHGGLGIAAKAGVIKIDQYYGLKMGQAGSEGVLIPSFASNSEIESKTSNRFISSHNVDYAVKKSLADSKLAGTAYAWTEDEKASARALLGAVSADDIGAIAGGTIITVGGQTVNSLAFDSDPQEQLDNKLSKTTEALKVYGTDSNGNEVLWNFRNTNNTKNTVAGRDSNGNVQVGTAVNPTDAVNKEYAESNFVTKTTGTYKVYGRKFTEEDEPWDAAYGAKENTVMIRNGQGRSKVKNPVDDDDITNKAFVEALMPKVIRVPAGV